MSGGREGRRVKPLESYMRGWAIFSISVPLNQTLDKEHAPSAPTSCPGGSFAIEAAIGGCLDKFLCHSRRDAAKLRELAQVARVLPGGRPGPLRCTKYFFDIPQYRQDLLSSLVQR